MEQSIEVTVAKLYERMHQRDAALEDAAAAADRFALAVDIVAAVHADSCASLAHQTLTILEDVAHSVLLSRTAHVTATAEAYSALLVAAQVCTVAALLMRRIYSILCSKESFVRENQPCAALPCRSSAEFAVCSTAGSSLVETNDFLNSNDQSGDAENVCGVQSILKRWERVALLLLLPTSLSSEQTSSSSSLPDNSTASMLGTLDDSATMHVWPACVRQAVYHSSVQVILLVHTTRLMTTSFLSESLLSRALAKLDCGLPMILRANRISHMYTDIQNVHNNRKQDDCFTSSTYDFDNTDDGIEWAKMEEQSDTALSLSTAVELLSRCAAAVAAQRPSSLHYPDENTTASTTVSSSSSKTKASWRTASTTRTAPTCRDSYTANNRKKDSKYNTTQSGQASLRRPLGMPATFGSSAPDLVRFEQACHRAGVALSQCLVDSLLGLLLTHTDAHVRRLTEGLFTRLTRRVLLPLLLRLSSESTSVYCAGNVAVLTAVDYRARVLQLLTRVSSNRYVSSDEMIIMIATLFDFFLPTSLTICSSRATRAGASVAITKEVRSSLVVHKNAFSLSKTNSFESTAEPCAEASADAQETHVLHATPSKVCSCTVKENACNMDLRCLPLLWTVIHRALWEATVGVHHSVGMNDRYNDDGKEKDAEKHHRTRCTHHTKAKEVNNQSNSPDDGEVGRGASAEMRASYLLKRLVDLTEREGMCDVDYTVAWHGRMVRHFSDCFVWFPASPRTCSSKPTAGGEPNMKRHDIANDMRNHRRHHSHTKKSDCTGTHVDVAHVAHDAIVVDGGSATLWRWFFIVQESLSEFGWHMVQPVLPKLDALIAQLIRDTNQSSMAKSATVSEAVSYPLHPMWVEWLLLKMIVHPNVGVRRVGLRRIWTLPDAVLRTFSSVFLHHYTFRSAADARLCTALDRTPITPAFFPAANTSPCNNNSNDTIKQQEEGDHGQAGCRVDCHDDCTSSMEPMAQALEDFYARLFRQGLPCCAELRAEALVRVIYATHSRASRFAVTCLVRVLHRIAHTLLEDVSMEEQQQYPGDVEGDDAPAQGHAQQQTNKLQGHSRQQSVCLSVTAAHDAACDEPMTTKTTTRASTDTLQRSATFMSVKETTVAMMQREDVLDALEYVMRDALQGNIPFWLDVRLTAIMLDSLLLFAAVSPSAMRVAGAGRFWRLCAMCGPLGGIATAHARLDACGQFGVVGAALDIDLVNARLCALSSQWACATSMNSARWFTAVPSASTLRDSATTSSPAAVASAYDAPCFGHTTSSRYKDSSHGMVRHAAGLRKKTPWWLVEGLLQPSTLRTRTAELLRCGLQTSSGAATPVNAPSTSAAATEAVWKGHFFLLGALQQSGSAEHATVLKSVCGDVVQAVSDWHNRVYGSAHGLLAAAAALVQLYHTATTTVTAMVPAVQRQTMMMTLRSHTSAVLEAVCGGEDVCSSRSSGSASPSSPSLSLCHTDSWDVLCAAWYVVQRLTVHADETKRTSVSGEEGQLDSAWLDTASAVQWLVDFVDDITDSSRAKYNHSPPSSSSSTNMEAGNDVTNCTDGCGRAARPPSTHVYSAPNAGRRRSKPLNARGSVAGVVVPHLLLARNATRLLQSILSGCVRAAQPGRSFLFSSSHTTSSTQPASPPQPMGCLLPFADARVIVTLIEHLIRSAAAAPCLTGTAVSLFDDSTLRGSETTSMDESVSTLRMEFTYGIYTTLYLLALCLDGYVRNCASLPASGACWTKAMMCVCRAVQCMYVFALSEMDRCWTSCLPAVYDLLGWVVMTWAQLHEVFRYLKDDDKTIRMQTSCSCDDSHHGTAGNADEMYILGGRSMFRNSSSSSCSDSSSSSDIAELFLQLQTLNELVSVRDVVQVMFDHAGEVGARQYTRLRARAFAVLQEAASVAGGEVRRILMDTLGLQQRRSTCDDAPESVLCDRDMHAIAKRTSPHELASRRSSGCIESVNANVCESNMYVHKCIHDARRRDNENDAACYSLHDDDDDGDGVCDRSNGWLTVVGDGETHREIFFATVTASVTLLSNVRTRWPWLADVLVSAAVLCNTGRDDEENESTWACTESLMQDWSSELRLAYPAAVRLADVGRAMALSTLLSCCAAENEDNNHNNDDGTTSNNCSINDLDRSGSDSSENHKETPALPAQRAVWLTWHLLRMHNHDAVLTREPCMPRSHTHRARVRLWQLMCALMPCLPNTRAVWEPILFSVLHSCMTKINLSSVRHWMEVYAIRVLVRQPALYCLLDAALARYNLRAQVCGSYILVACHVLLHHVSSSPSSLQHTRTGADQNRSTHASLPKDVQDVPVSICPGTEAVVLDEGSGRGCVTASCRTLVDDNRHTQLHHQASHAAARQHASLPCTDDLYHTLMRRVLQYSSSHQHLLRIISHIGLCRVYESVRNDYTVSAELSTLYDSLTHTEEHQRLRQKHEAALFFDSACAVTPRELFCRQQYEGDGLVCDALPAALFERVRFVESEMATLTATVWPVEWLRLRYGGPHRVNALAKLERRFGALALIPHTALRAECTVDYTPEAVAFLRSDPLESASSPRYASCTTFQNNSNSNNNSSNGTSKVGDEPTHAICTDTVHARGVAEDENTQQKVTAWWVSEIYNELHPRVLRHTRQPFIIVGSLLDNPVNIAGLCRCAEIFSIERVVVPDAKVFKHPHFIAAARSAELWTPWEAVGAQEVPTFLARMKLAGYTIIGVEQTVDSVSMALYEFPERVVVVLGAEGQGVPAPLIPQLDVCVEIPQYGLIRSLNVHVAGAIAMYEYTKQHRMSVRP